MTDHHTTTAPAPSDNLFGICAALGEDFGFNPMWLRMAFAVALLFDLEKVLVTYAALGVLVLVSRLLFPNRTVAIEAQAAHVVPEIDMPEYRAAA